MLAGLGAIVAGAFAVFTTENGTGSAALLGVGFLLLMIAAFFDRIEALELAGAKVVLRKLERAADDLEKRARALSEIAEAMKPAASDYERVRKEMPRGPARTRIMDELVDKISADAKDSSFSRDQVRELFKLGGEGNRLTAVALMQGNAELRDFNVVVDVIRQSVSGNELYQGLQVAELMIPDLNSSEQRRLIEALEEPRKKAFLEQGSPQWATAQRIESRIGQESI